MRSIIKISFVIAVVAACSFAPAGAPGGKVDAGAVDAMVDSLPPIDASPDAPIDAQPTLSVALTCPEIEALQVVRNLREGQEVTLAYSITGATGATTCNRTATVNGVVQPTGDWVGGLVPISGEIVMVLPRGETIYDLNCVDGAMNSAQALTAYAMKFNVLLFRPGGLPPIPATWNPLGWYDISAGNQIILEWEAPEVGLCISSGNWGAGGRAGRDSAGPFLPGNAPQATYVYILDCLPYRASVVVKVGGG